MAENISNLENADDFDQIVTPSDELIKSFEHMLVDIGEDTARDGLVDTPKRAAAAFKFLNHGYKLSLEKVVNNALFESDIEDMVVVRDIEFYSLCEHLRLPFNGRCHVAYIPNGKEEIRILQGSGEQVLDQAAVDIVRLAAPFDEFPAELRGEVDLLEIIRTWKFDANRRVSSK